MGQAALTRCGAAVLPAGKAPLRRSDGFEHRSPLLQRAPGRPTLPDGGAGGGGLHAAGAEVGDGGDARRRSRRASQLPRAAVSSAATVIRAPRRDRTYSLMISSCPVSCGWALRRYWRGCERARGAAWLGRAAAEAAGHPQRSSSLAGEDGDGRRTSPTTTRSSTSSSRCYSIPIPLSFTKITQL